MRPKLLVNDDTDGTACEAAAEEMMRKMPYASSAQFDISNTPVLSGNLYIGTLNKQSGGLYASIFAISHNGSAVIKTRGYSGWGPWRKLAMAEPPAIMALPLAAGFTNWNQINSTYRKDDAGMVHIVLSLQPSGKEAVTNGTIVATLPEGYRPLQDTYQFTYDLYSLRNQRINWR